MYSRFKKKTEVIHEIAEVLYIYQFNETTKKNIFHDMNMKVLEQIQTHSKSIF